MHHLQTLLALASSLGRMVGVKLHVAWHCSHSFSLAADKELKYECVSIKKLKMSRVVLKRKTGDISSNKQPDNSKETTRQEAIYSSS